MCSASTPTITTARGRIARLICDRRIQGTKPHDQRSARSSATTGSAASSTSTTELPHETDTNIGALHAAGGLGDSVLVGVADCLGAVACAGLGEDVVDVRLDRRAADHERGGDLGVGEAGGNEFEDFDLP
jgi:hypothetical protein